MLDLNRSNPKHSHFRIALMLLPVLLVIGGLFVGGLLLALVQSLGYFPSVGEHSFTTAHYRSLLVDDEFRNSLLLTFELASASTLISAAAGLALALPLREIARRSSVFNALLQVPIAVPHLVMAVVLLNVIAPSGLIARDRK